MSIEQTSRPRIQSGIQNERAPFWALLSGDPAYRALFKDVFGDAAVVFSRLEEITHPVVPVGRHLVLFCDLCDEHLRRDSIFKRMTGSVFTPGEMIYVSDSATTATIVAAMRSGAYSVIDRASMRAGLEDAKSELIELLGGEGGIRRTGLAADETSIEFIEIQNQAFRPLCSVDGEGQILRVNLAFREFMTACLGLRFDQAQPGLNFFKDDVAGATVEFKTLTSRLTSLLERGRALKSDASETLELDPNLPQPKWRLQYFADRDAFGITTEDGAGAETTLLLKMSIDLVRTPTASLDTFLSNAIQDVRDLCGAESGYLMLVDEAESRCQLRYLRGRAKTNVPQLKELEDFPLEKLGFYQWFLRRQAVVVADASALGPEFEAQRQARVPSGVKSDFQVPVYIDGRLVAVLGNLTKSFRTEWSEPARALVLNFSNLVADALRRTRLESDLRPFEEAMIHQVRTTTGPSLGIRFDIPIPIHIPMLDQAAQILGGRFVHCNEGLAKFYGLADASLAIGRTWGELVGENRDRAMRAILTFLRMNYRVDQYLVPEETYEIGGTMRVFYRALGVVRDGALREVWVSFLPIPVVPGLDAAEAAFESDVEPLVGGSMTYRNSSLTSDKIVEIQSHLERLFELEKPYRDSNFNLAKLAKLLKISPYQVSQVLSSGLKTGFYDLINRHRIEDFKKLLEHPGSRSKPILDLAVQVGFNSKSTFNVAFKKIVGLTPSQYRSSN